MDAASIKKFIYNLIITSMIFYIVAKTVSGIETSDQLMHWIMMVGAYSIALALIKPILKFLTLPSNFLFHWLVGTVLGFGAFYAMTMIFPGIRITDTLIDGKSIGIISINPTHLSPIFTMVLGGAYGSFINTLLYWLKKS
jgi:uncharacterized membrane protein YvlD (DUF360 family)